MMWPIGLPFLLLIILEMYNVPALSADMRNSAALKAFLDNIGVSNKLSLGSSFIENLCRAFGKAPNDNYSTIAYLKAYSVFHLKTEMTMMKDQADPNKIKDKSDHDDEDDARKGGHGGKAADDSASDGEGAGQDGTLHVGFMGKLKKKAKRKKKGARELERFAGAEKKDLAFLHYFFARTMFKCTLIKDYFEIWKGYNRDEEDEKRKLQGLDESLPPSGSTQLENPSQFQVPLVKPKTLEDKVVEMATEMERIRTLVMEKRQQRAYVKSRKRRARGKKKMKLIGELAELDKVLHKYETLNVLDEKNINARDVHRFFDSYLKLSKSAQARLVEILHSAKRFFLPGHEPDAKEGGATPDAEDGGVTEEAQDALIAKLGIDAASAPMLDDDVTAAFDLLQDESFVACGQIEAPEDVVQPKKTAAAWCPCWPAKTQSPDHDDPDPPQASWCLCWPKTESKDGIPQQGEPVSGDNASKKQRPTTVHHMLLAFVNTLIAKEKVGVPVIAWRQADDKFLSPANLVRRSGPADRATKFNVYKGKADFVFLGDEEFQMTKTKAHGRAGFLYESLLPPIDPPAQRVQTCAYRQCYPGTRRMRSSSGNFPCSPLSASPPPSLAPSAQHVGSRADRQWGGQVLRGSGDVPQAAHDLAAPLPLPRQADPNRLHHHHLHWLPRGVHAPQAVPGPGAGLSAVHHFARSECHPVLRLAHRHGRRHAEHRHRNYQVRQNHGLDNHAREHLLCHRAASGTPFRVDQEQSGP
eukprot:2411835-Rhodomonas_salina.1